MPMLSRQRLLPKRLVVFETDSLATGELQRNVVNLMRGIELDLDLRPKTGNQPLPERAALAVVARAGILRVANAAKVRL